MKRIAFLLLLITFALRAEPSSEDRLKEQFRKLKESAHPSPEIQKKKVESNKMLESYDESDMPLFLNPCMIIEAESEPSPIQNESSIAVNPKNPLNLIGSSVDYRDSSSTWVYVSSDGGRTWINKNLGKPFPHWTASNDPSVIFDANGYGYLCVGAHGSLSGENAVMVAKTTNQGVTWKAHIPVIVHQGVMTADSNFEDKYYLHVDNSPVSPTFGRIYNPWKRVINRDSSTQIVITYSDDQGETWQVPKPISLRLTRSSEDTTFGQSFPLARTGPNGEVYVVWNYGPKKSIGFCKSLDAGKNYSEPRLIQKYDTFGKVKMLSGQGFRHTLKGGVRAEAYPSLVVDNTSGARRGWLYLVWHADSVPNVYFSRSTNGGDDWSAPKIVHSETKNDQFWSWTAIDPSNGDLAVIYLDSRNDTNNLLCETYVSYSSDGGDTWIDKKASSAWSDLRNNPFPGKNFAGDYSGCDFYNGKIYPSWVDMRNTTSSNVFDSDVYTAIISVNAPLAPENFKAKPIVNNAGALALSWDMPKSKTFGKSINASEMKYVLYRNSIFYKVFNGDVLNFVDESLSPHIKYDYSIKAFINEDTSSATLAFGYPNGAVQPSSPLIVDKSRLNNSGAQFQIKAPNTRLDGIMPLINLAKIKIYRDSLFVKEILLNANDTNKIINIKDTVAKKQFYKYTFTAIDGEGNESPLSESALLFVGEPESLYTENFDFADGKFKFFNKWMIIKDFANSLNNVANITSSNYSNNERDTMYMFPITTSLSSIALNFSNAAIMHKNDYGAIEYSTDNMQSWKGLAYYDKTYYSYWADGALDSKDWRTENLTISDLNSNMLYVRFRFFSDASATTKGWFIDNIGFAEPNSVAETIEKDNSIVYPNPVGDLLYIKLDSKALVNIYDYLGKRVISSEFNAEKSVSTLNVASLTNGVYLVEIRYANGKIRTARISK